ncbi:MAG: glycine cleavage system protein GcvH [SAR202 cluster bacterium]|nr:glycine cleavage system protein GcvH [SAR202 cluster bacterium]
MENYKYSKEHEWVKVESDEVALIGISEHAAETLGDIVFVELPEIDDSIQQFEKMGEIESVKAVSDLFSPITGKVLEVNAELIDQPEKINESAETSGWMIKVVLTNSSELENLMSESEYLQFVENEE